MSEQEPGAATPGQARQPAVGPGRAAYEQWAAYNHELDDYDRDLTDMERGQWYSIGQAAIDGSEYVRQLERDAAAWQAVQDDAGEDFDLAAYQLENGRIRAERDSLQWSCQLLGQVLVSQARSLYGAWIEANRDDLPAMREWVLNGVPDVDDNEPDDQWNGTETADEWFERTQDDGDAPKPQAQAVSHLRALLDQATTRLHDSHLPTEQAAADELRERGQLGALS